MARLAAAMDCDLVYAIVPRDSLEETMNVRAIRVIRVAEELVGRVADSMELEAQGTSPDERDRLVHELAERLREDPRRIWDV